MHLTGFDFFLWAAGFVLHAILLLVLWVRRRARSFPIFTGLIILDIVRTIALFCLQRFGSIGTYFYTYWSLAILDVALQLGVVYEMASRVFRPCGEWVVDVKHRLIWWVGGSIIIAVALTSIPEPATQFWVQVITIKGSFFSAALLSQLFIGMIVLSVTAGLSWNTQVARISQGLGFYSLATVLIETGDVYLGVANGTKAYETLNRFRIAVYLGCVVFWIVMLSRQDEAPRTMTDRMRQQLSAVHDAAARHAELLRSRRNQ
jgi:hypothetical protein